MVKYCEDHCSPTAGQLEGLSGGLRLIRRMVGGQVQPCHSPRPTDRATCGLISLLWLLPRHLATARNITISCCCFKQTKNVFERSAILNLDPVFAKEMTLGRERGWGGWNDWPGEEVDGGGEGNEGEGGDKEEETGESKCGRTDEHAGPLNVVQDVLVDQTRPNWPGQVPESILDSDSESQGVNW